ncbi:MAG: hydrogenase maturation nickel metallochaperone HypA [Anaerolineae bacterium]
MHELAVTQGILSVALDAADRAGARRIAAIDLVIGDLASIVDDSVQFYFDILARGSPAEGAALRFRRIPADGHCLACGAEFTVGPSLVDACPVCGSAQLLITGGREFYVESIEVDDENPGGAGDSEREREPGR